MKVLIKIVAINPTNFGKNLLFKNLLCSNNKYSLCRLSSNSKNVDQNKEKVENQPFLIIPINFFEQIHKLKLDTEAVAQAIKKLENLNQNNPTTALHLAAIVPTHILNNSKHTTFDENMYENIDTLDLLKNKNSFKDSGVNESKADIGQPPSILKAFKEDPIQAFLVHKNTEYMIPFKVNDDVRQQFIKLPVYELNLEYKIETPELEEFIAQYKNSLKNGSKESRKKLMQDVEPLKFDAEIKGAIKLQPEKLQALDIDPIKFNTLLTALAASVCRNVLQKRIEYHNQEMMSEFDSEYDSDRISGSVKLNNVQNRSVSIQRSHSLPELDVHSLTTNKVNSDNSSYKESMTDEELDLIKSKLDKAEKHQDLNVLATVGSVACDGAQDDKKDSSSGKKEEKKDNPCGKKEDKKDNPCGNKEEKKDSPCGKKEEKKDSPCGKKEEKKDSPCGKKEEQKDSPCGKKPELKDSPCGKKEEKKDNPCGNKEEKKDSPCGKKEEKKDNPCGKKEEKKDSPCGKKEEKKDSPCGKKEEKKDSPCGKKEEKKDSPCGKKEEKKDSPCGKKEEKKDSPCGKKEEKKDSPCGKKEEKKDSPCGKKEEKKDSPCGKKEEKKDNPCGKKEEKKDNPCGKKEEKKDSPCGKKEEKKDNPCGKKEEKKDNPCGKKEEKKDNPCGKKEEKKDNPCPKKDNPCGKKEEKKDNPCGKKEEKKDNPCGKKEEKKDSPCGKKEEKKDSPCGKKDEKKDSPCGKKDEKKDSPCGKKEEKKDSPNGKKNEPKNSKCGGDKKGSTSAKKDDKSASNKEDKKSYSSDACGNKDKKNGSKGKNLCRGGENKGEPSMAACKEDVIHTFEEIDEKTCPENTNKEESDSKVKSCNVKDKKIENSTCGMKVKNFCGAKKPKKSPPTKKTTAKHEKPDKCYKPC